MAIRHIRLSEEQEQRLISWLDESLDDIQERIDARSARWVEWRRLYEGKASPKTFPWKGASNVFVPLVGALVDAIHANMINRLFGYERLWDVKAVRPAQAVGQNPATNQPILWSDIAEEIQVFLARYAGDSGPTDTYPVVNHGFLEAIKLGTQVTYNPWSVLTQPDFKLLEDGTYAKAAEVTIFDGPLPRLIPLEDFTILPGYWEIHGPNASPLVGHYSWFRKAQLRTADKLGYLRPGALEKVLGTPGSDYNTGEQVKDAQHATEGDPHSESDIHENDYRIWHGWCAVDFNDDGYEEHITVDYHRATGTLLSVRPYLYKSRPYTVSRYVTRENRFYGIGIPELLQQLQAALNTVYNQTIDNATLANTRWFKVRRGGTTAQTFDEIWPGKKVYVDNMEDIQAEQLGEIYPSMFELARSLVLHAERRAGISDPNLGRDPDPRTPATSTMALLQESTRRFDLYAKDIRRSLSEMGMQYIELIQQFKPTGAIYTIAGADKGGIIERTLLVPQEINLREHLRVITTSSATSTNKEIARQNAIAAVGVLGSYADRVVQLAGVISNPQVPPSLAKLLNEVAEMFERLMRGHVLEGFDMQDLGAVLPQLDQLYAESQRARESLPPPVPPGGGGPPQALPGGGVRPGMPGPGGPRGGGAGPGVPGPQTPPRRAVQPGGNGPFRR